MTAPDLVIAAIVPCYNEAPAIAKVVRDLQRAVPGIDVYVYDNNSTDGTAEVARAAGAEVRYERMKGKGNVLRRAFGDIDADVYVLIDGDDTYDASAAPRMIQTLLDGPYDHVLGTRVDDPNASAYRPGHATGNKIFNRIVGRLFGLPVTDMLSGYRVMSRRFVKSFPALSREFETETEITVHSMNLRVPQIEIPTAFKDRAEGTESKLNTVSDGLKILSLIGHLIRFERPVLFHGLIGAIFALIAIVLAIPLFVEYAHTGLVPRFPTAVLAASLMVIAILTWVLGFVLEGITRLRRETSRLNYLTYSAPGQPIKRLPLEHPAPAGTADPAPASPAPAQHAN
ncbi:glycosyltransferase [Curtobacterium ammoniigenes]|uniref:glycosyltransferase n=1 Tax=Curtobacterium ammoniigenes TaxID=395387 RepID=UPI000B05FDA7|nr:glycosyltransferase [Curtobacterium ammoniigenes]